MSGAMWTGIALHTTPGIPQHMHPVVALVTAGVEMDVLGLTYPDYSNAEREAVVRAHPRGNNFEETSAKNISARLPRSRLYQPERWKCATASLPAIVRDTGLRAPAFR